MSKPWIRLYTDLPSNPKAQRLPGDLFKFWINCLCLYGKRGYFPPAKDIAWALQVSEKITLRNIRDLIDAGLLDESPRDKGFENLIVDAIHPHDWDDLQFESDASRERQKKYRDRHAKHNKAVTSDVTVTVQEQNRTEQIQSRAETEATDPVADSYFLQFTKALSDLGFRNPDDDANAAYTASKIAEVCEQAGALPKLGAFVAADLMKSRRFAGKPLEYMLGALRSELAPKGQNQRALQKVAGIQ